jgi:hypothetical protein
MRGVRAPVPVAEEVAAVLGRGEVLQRCVQREAAWRGAELSGR